MTSQAQQITTSPYQPPSQRFSWDEFYSSARGERRALKGDRLALTGSVTFELRESGWVAIAANFDLVHMEAEAFWGEWSGYGAPYVGSTEVDEDPRVNVKVGRDGSKFTVVQRWARDDRDRVFTATYQDGRIVMDGNPQDFYKGEVPTIAVDEDGRVWWWEAAGVLLLKRE